MPSGKALPRPEGKNSMKQQYRCLISRLGFWGPLCYGYNQELQNSIGSYLGPYITAQLLSSF